jgi:hypothetical protein
MRLALVVAVAALFSCSAASAFNPQPDPPGRHGGKILTTSRKAGGQHGEDRRTGGDQRSRCHDRHGRPEKCR